MIRSVAGDTVVVELLPSDQWGSPAEDAYPDYDEDEEEDEEDAREEAGEEAGRLGRGEAGRKAKTATKSKARLGRGKAGLADWTGDGTSSNAVGRVGAEGGKPRGKVVGILKRNWRRRGYCASLKAPSDGTGFLLQSPSPPSS